MPEMGGVAEKLGDRGNILPPLVSERRSTRANLPDRRYPHRLLNPRLAAELKGAVPYRQEHAQQNGLCRTSDAPAPVPDATSGPGPGATPGPGLKPRHASRPDSSP